MAQKPPNLRNLISFSRWILSCSCDHEKDADCSLVDNLIGKKLILSTFRPDAPVLLTLALKRTGASGQNFGKISFFAIKLSTIKRTVSIFSWSTLFVWNTIHTWGTNLAKHIYYTVAYILVSSVNAWSTGYTTPIVFYVCTNCQPSYLCSIAWVWLYNCMWLMVSWGTLIVEVH